MNLFYEDYPTVLKVENEFIPIITDFREYIKLLDMLNDEEVNGYEKMLFLRQYFLKEPKNMDDAISRLTDFVSMKELNDVQNQNRFFPLLWIILIFYLDFGRIME